MEHAGPRRMMHWLIGILMVELAARVPLART
jgi:hypothetical protein